MWGLSPTDGNAAINAYKIAQGITNPCAGTEGGGPEAIDIVIQGQSFYGYPTYCVVCPDKTMYFDICWPPSSASCFDPYIEDCGYMALTANFTSDVTELCQYDAVSFVDQSVGDITSWNWTFEGGEPATSTDQNPVVTYNETGTFSVELEVSDGTNSNSFYAEDYVTVLMTPPVMLMPFDDACLTDPPFELTGGTPAGGVYSGPGVNSGWFDPASAGLGLHTVLYTYMAANGCENAAEQTLLVDECTGIPELEGSALQLYPNPTSGNIEISFRAEGIVQVQVFNMLGVTVADATWNANGTEKRSFDLSSLESGIYFISVSTPEMTRTEKIKLLNP